MSLEIILKQFNCPSDNRTCRRGFRSCYNQRCVASGRFCDGIDDCGDNSDEAFCSSEFAAVWSHALACLWGQDLVTLMPMLIQLTRPHAVLSPRCLISPEIIRSAQIKRDAQPLPLEVAWTIFGVFVFFFYFAGGTVSLKVFFFFFLFHLCLFSCSNWWEWENIQA